MKIAYEETLWTVTNPKGEVQYCWAMNSAEARRDATFPGKKSERKAERTRCEYQNHALHRNLQHQYAVAIIHNTPMCPECAEHASKSPYQRVEELESRMTLLENNLADHEDPHRYD